MSSNRFRWLKSSVERQWYARPHWLLLLLPLSWLFRLFAARRRRHQLISAYVAPLPVVVVGNIAVGGTGKTPVIIALCAELCEAGWRPVVISRGYGTRQEHSRVLPPEGTAAEYGDEPVLIANATGCPVVIGPDRVASARLVAQRALGDIILSDDGLQHYRLARTWEIAVIDSSRRLGNGRCLPVGPLREPVGRLQEVDAIIVNGAPFTAAWLPVAKTHNTEMRPRYWRHVKTGRRIEVHELNLDGACAIAGIGHPDRFFETLRSLGFAGTTRAFPDHHAFRPEDLAAADDRLLLMTEKDAVKVQAFAGDQWWALSVAAELPPGLLRRLQQAIGRPQTQFP